jgi:hypothetical protein
MPTKRRVRDLSPLQIPLTFRIYHGENLLREETLTQEIIKIGKLESSHLVLGDTRIVIQFLYWSCDEASTSQTLGS